MAELYENRNYVGLLRILYCAFLTKTYACPTIEKLRSKWTSIFLMAFKAFVQTQM